MVNSSETAANDSFLEPTIDSTEKILPFFERPITKRRFLKITAAIEGFIVVDTLSRRMTPDIENPINDDEAQFQYVMSDSSRIIDLNADENGNRFDTFKIAELDKGLIGVSHSKRLCEDGVERLVTCVWTADNLLDWKFHNYYEEGYVMPCIHVEKNGMILMGGEKNEGNPEGTKNDSWIDIALYDNLDDFYDKKHSWKLTDEIRSKLAKFGGKRFFSKTNEGTISFREVTINGSIKNSKIVADFHYNDTDWATGNTTDKNATITIINGVIDHVEINHELNNPMILNGVAGAIGQREYAGNKTVIEIQRIRNYLRSFRIYAFDNDTKKYFRIPLRSKSGSEAFANPRITELKDGRIVVTYFVFEEDETKSQAKMLIFNKGELIYDK